MIVLSVWLASKGSQTGCGCHEANDHSFAMDARCRVDSVCVLRKDSSVTGAQMSQYNSCLPWHCRLGCSNGRWSAIKQF